MKFTIQTADAQIRLDRLLAEKLGQSRSFMQKQIKDKRVTVNGKNTNAHYPPRGGDVVEITKTEPDVVKISPNKDVAFKIAAENKDYIVIEKPSGLIVHPARGVHEPTLADGLVAKYPELSGVGEDELRPGIVHRLDRNVSGLMVVARAQKMFDNLKNQFQKRKITKEYTALVHGIIDNEQGIINTPIGRSQTKSGKMSAHPPTPKTTEDERPQYQTDREAKTEYHVIDRIKNYTLLRVIIYTGRSHQIRVHLNSIGHPVVGDTLYTNKRVKHVDLGRLFLHANKLGFDDMSGKRQEYESSLPNELNIFLKNI